MRFSARSLTPPLDVVADAAYLVERPASGVGDVPVLDYRGDVRALGAAREGDCPVGVQLHLERQLLRSPALQVDADLAHRLDDDRVDAVAGLGAGRLGAHVGRPVPLEQRLRHLGAPGVLGADEEHVLHFFSS